MKEGSSSRKPLGCDPNSSLLYAQVISGEPKMIIDEDGFLRSINWYNKKNNIFLGDVANVSIRSLGPHDPPKFIKQPEYDEQKWTLKSSAGELKIKITSDSYWGFGLFSKYRYRGLLDYFNMGNCHSYFLMSAKNDLKFKVLQNIEVLGSLIFSKDQVLII